MRRRIQFKALLACALVFLTSSAATADITHVQVQAMYKSREGSIATIHYRGRDLKVPVDRILDLSKKTTGQIVNVNLRPEEAGLYLRN